MIPASQNLSFNICPLCPGDGWVSVKGGLAPCRCQLEKRIRRILPPLYWNAQLAHIDSTLQQRILEFLENPSSGMLFMGPAGAGKTYAMAATMREQLSRGKAADFRRWATLYASLRQAYRINSSEDAALKPYCLQPFLALDDLGAGSCSDHERRSTFEVLEQRLNHCLPTIITTNLTLKQIAKSMDDRIASRLSGFSIIKFTGRDQRMPATAWEGDNLNRERADVAPFVVSK